MNTKGVFKEGIEKEISKSSKTIDAVIIKFLFLILNTFQISISFYPIIPGIGNDIFKMNAFKTSDFGFKDFELGKPGATVFQ